MRRLIKPGIANRTNCHCFSTRFCAIFTYHTAISFIALSKYLKRKGCVRYASPNKEINDFSSISSGNISHYREIKPHFHSFKGFSYFQGPYSRKNCWFSLMFTSSSDVLYILRGNEQSFNICIVRAASGF